jgi:hypothetical protein
MVITPGEEGTDGNIIGGYERIFITKTAAKIRCYQEDLCHEQPDSHPQ